MASQFAADGTVKSLRSYIWRSFLIVSLYPIRSLRNLGNVSEVPMLDDSKSN